MSLFLGATFGFDGDGTLVEPTLDGAVVPARLTVYLGKAIWQVGDLDAVDDYCTVEFPLAGGVLAPWAVGSPSIYWGTDYPGGPLGGTCGTAASTVDLTGLGDPLTDWEGQPGIGVAVGNRIPDVTQVLVDSGLDPNQFAGGQIRMGVLLAAPSFGVYTTAYEVDPATLEVVLDTEGEPVQLSAAQIHPYP